MGTSQKGDAEAFARLYGQHYRAIHGYVSRRVGSGDADEVTAEVFLVAWRRWPDAAAAGLPWLYTTAGYAISTFLRSRQRHDHAVQHLRAVARSAAGEAAEASAERVVAARALLTLSDRDREVLLAAAWDGLSGPELAAALGCSTAAAHVRLHRARRRLDAALDATHPRTDLLEERQR